VSKALHFEPLKLPNFDLNVDPEPAFPSNADSDPDTASTINADPRGYGSATLLVVDIFNCCVVKKIYKTLGPHVKF
jgi:hypothetical protein